MVIQRVWTFTRVVQAVNGQGQLQALPVDYTVTTERNIVGSICIDQGTAVVDVGRLAYPSGCSCNIVARMRAPSQGGSLLKMYLHPRFHDQRACKIDATGNRQPSAAIGADTVDGVLQLRRAKRLSTAVDVQL